MIRAIFFDLEGVITSTPQLLHKNFFDKIKDIISFEELNARYKKAKIGKMDYKEFMIGLEEYENFLFSCISFRKNAREILEHFYSRNIPLFIASNHIDFLSEKSLEILGIKKLFRKTFFSNQLGIAKPDKKFFETILKESGLNLKKGEMLFIDDTKRNLVIAKELGFVTVYLPNGIKDDKRNQIVFEADYTIKNLKELILLMSKLNN